MKKKCVLDVKELGKRFADMKVFERLRFNVKDGEIVALLGPSGCGKSTLLRMIAGLESVDDGEIIHSNEGRQSIGYVFQKPILYPHLDVE